MKFREVAQCKIALADICHSQGFNLDDVLSKRRMSRYVKMRHACMQELRRLGFSYPVIGEAMQRDHATIIYAVKKAAQQGEGET